MVIGIILCLQILLFTLGIIITCKSKVNYNNIKILPTWVKLVLSLSLILSALLIYKDGIGVLKIYSFFVLMGMIFSSIGDLTRAKIIKFAKDPLEGGLAFVLAHIMYISAFIITTSKAGYSFMSQGFYLGIVFYQVIFWGGWILYIGRKKFKFKMGLLCYGSLLCIMASSAASMAWSAGGAWIIAALGTFFFFISDFLIGIIDYGGAPIKHRHIWVWMTYLLGQIGIIYMPWIERFYS